MNSDKFFIYAGPHKTGSTWLYEVLDKHPETQMPLRKELVYFRMNEVYKNANFLKKLFGKHPLFKRRRNQALNLFKRTIRKKLNSTSKGGEFRWLLYFFFRKENDDWYKNLFSKEKVSGDISPAYSKFSENTIKEIKTFNPNTKIIIGLRDPIERKWSDIKMRLVSMQGKKSIEEVDKQTLANALNHNDPNFDDYTILIDKWRKYFDEQQILVYYYEELTEDPQKLYNKICKFLEIQPVRIEGIEKVINKGKVDKISMEYEKNIVKVNYKYIEKFAKNYPNQYSLAWLEKYRDYDT